jgi:hypothetical protein
MVVAEVAAKLPARLRHKLDASPGLANVWAWLPGEGSLRIDCGEGTIVTLTLDGETITRFDALRCTCLLGPNCLHVAAVLMALPLAEGIPTGDTQVALVASPGPQVLDASARNAVNQLWVAAAGLVQTGASTTGIVGQGEILRAVHSCRAAGLHRPAAAGVRIVSAIRELQADKPEFRLEDLTTDVYELLAVAHGLRREGPADTRYIGTARRVYSPVGALRVFGIFSEPVISRAGFAGVVTYVCDSTGRLFTLPEVKPGDAGRTTTAYDGSIDLGDASMTHRELSRAGLHIQGATASIDGRLGSGTGARAVSASGAGWSEAPIDRLWSASLTSQLDRAWATLDLPIQERPAGSDLLFVTGIVRGLDDVLLRIEVENDGAPGAIIVGLPPLEHAEVAYIDNLHLLGDSVSLRLRMIGRLIPDLPRTVALLAAEPIADGAMAKLPSSWRGRINLGLDRLQRSYLAGGSTTPQGSLAMAPTRESETDPLERMRRRLARVVIGGRSTLGDAAWDSINKDAGVLRREQLPTAAELLTQLAAAVRPSGDGARANQGRGDNLARAWLAAATYERAASRRLARLRWQKPEGN